VVSVALKVLAFIGDFENRVKESHSLRHPPPLAVNSGALWWMATSEGAVGTEFHFGSILIETCPVS